MYQARYLRIDGSAAEAEVALPAALFDGVIHEGALHQAVVAYLANQRQGTVGRKNRSAVRGGSRKPWRQKGTGRARQGTTRAAQWRGGGRAFPPQPKSWRRKLPRKVRALARASAFNSRAAEGRVLVIEGFDFDAPKTRRLVALLGRIGQPGKILFLTHGVNRDLYLSGRNLSEVRVLPFGQESPFDVVWSGAVIIEEGALAAIGGAEPAPDAAPEDEAGAADEADADAVADADAEPGEAA